MFYGDVFEALNKEKVKYVVAGGVALNLHGIPRVTGDLDLLLDLSQNDIIKFSKAMDRIGFVPKVPVRIEDFGNKKKRQQWIKDKGMRVFSLWNRYDAYRIIDVFVENPIDFKELYRKKVDISIGEFTISVVCVEHLIKLKKMAGRKQDISDIRSLRRVRELRQKYGS